MGSWSLSMAVRVSGPLGVEQVGERALLPGNLASAVKHRLLRLMIAVGEVEARHAHARIDELSERFLVPALGTRQYHDLGLAHWRRGEAEHFLERDGRGVVRTPSSPRTPSRAR